MAATNLPLSNSLQNGASQQHVTFTLNECRHSSVGDVSQTALHKVNELQDVATWIAVADYEK
jgi:hypothetical protein